MSALDDRISRLSPAQRAALEQQLLERRASRAAATIPKRTSSEPAPLSFVQERLWLVQELAPEAAPSNIPHARRILGLLDEAALEHALRHVAARHDILRTVYGMADSGPVQFVTDRLPELARVDLSQLSHAAADDALRALMREGALAPFDLRSDPPLRATLVVLSEVERVLFTVSHHIAFDGWSAQLFGQELFDAYAAFAAGAAPAASALPIQYADYAAWQREVLTDATTADDVAFWVGKLADAPGRTELDADRPRTAAPTYRGSRVYARVPDSVSARLREFGRSVGATPFMVLLTAFQTLLWRHTGQACFLIAVPTLGRTPPVTEQLLGCFANDVFIRADVHAGDTFRDSVARTRAAALEAFAHQRAPFERVIDAVRGARGDHLTPQVMFQSRRGGSESREVAGVRITDMPVERQTSAFDLSVDIVERADILECAFEYSADVFERDTVERLAQRYCALIESALCDPDRPISRLAIMPPTERARLRDWGLGTPAPLPAPPRIHSLFEQQVARTPEATALIADEGQARLTFAELDARANRLASRLRQAGVRPGDIVGVCLERCLDLPAAMLGALKAGAAYLPLDPAYPHERIAFMLQDAQPAAVIARRATLGLLSGAPALLVDEEPASIAPSSSPRAEDSAGDAAYVIYTSGSTGRPKGVIGTHVGAVNRFAWMWRTYPFAPGEVCALKTPISFVDSVWECFGPLLQGVSVAIIPDDTVRDVPRLVESLAVQAVTRTVLVPSLLRAMLDVGGDLAQRLPYLRLWVSSGEALPAELARRFHAALPGRMLLNLYGSSEVAADVTCYDTAALPASASAVPIGAPIDNTRLLILDADGEPVPPGVVGELYAGGSGLAAGYLRRDALTAERFVTLGDGADAGRYFRTGDLARWSADGHLEFAGRADTQVKVRGFRVELGEIEAVLRAQPGVRDAAVAARRANDDTLLVAYVVGDDADIAALRAGLRAELIDYMVPAHFVRLDTLPLLPNGKVDRRALPEPTAAHASAPAQEAGRIAPRTELELQLAPIWESVLNVKPIGVRDDFFDLGGHSLSAARLIAEVERQMGIRLRLSALFEAPTIEQLAQALYGRPREGGLSTLVPIKREGAREPFFCVHGFGGAVLNYVSLARAMKQDRPFYALKAAGFEGEAEPDTRIDAMASRYVAAIRTVQPRGPYYLGGHCFGGVVAFEMARQLQAAGECVARVELIDAFTPERPRRANAVLHPVAFVRNMIGWLSENGWRRFARRFSYGLRRDLQRARGRPVLTLDDVLVNPEQVPDDLRGLTQTHLDAMRAYRVGPYTGDVDLYRVAVQPPFRAHQPDNGWGRFVRGAVRVHHVPGDHRSIVLDMRDVQALAGALDAALDD